MSMWHRRAFLLLAGSVTAGPARSQEMPPSRQPDGGGRSVDIVRGFVAEAERMRAKAIAAGDQPFGAIVVSGDRIIGWGPSRVVVDRNPKAHAERVAIMDAQLRLAAVDLGGAVMYSTTKPCPMCEDAAALAGIARVYWGRDAMDAGRPRRQ